MEPADAAPAVLAGVRRRRRSLRAAMADLENGIAAPASGRADLWREGVRAAVEGLMVQVREHIASTEGPEGFHADLLAEAPRLSNAVSRLVGEHRALTVALDRLGERAKNARSTEDIEAVRALGTDVVSDISRHRQRGADLIYEAYEHDIGGED